jgi:hypothetical protein
MESLLVTGIGKASVPFTGAVRGANLTESNEQRLPLHLVIRRKERRKTVYKEKEGKGGRRRRMEGKVEGGGRK